MIYLYTKNLILLTPSGNVVNLDSCDGVHLPKIHHLPLYCSDIVPQTVTVRSFRPPTALSDVPILNTELMCGLVKGNIGPCKIKMYNTFTSSPLDDTKRYIFSHLLSIHLQILSHLQSKKLNDICDHLADSGKSSNDSNKHTDIGHDYCSSNNLSRSNKKELVTIIQILLTPVLVY